VTQCSRYFSYLDNWLFWALFHWAKKALQKQQESY
jgi:hypothetical protein